MDCSTGEDEIIDTCPIFSSQRMLQKGVELLKFSKFYENKFPNWVIPTGALWITSYFLSQVVQNDTVKAQLKNDFGITMKSQDEQILMNIKNISIAESEFYYTSKANFKVKNQFLIEQIYKKYRQKRKSLEFFYGNVERTGIFVDADFQRALHQNPINHTFNSGDENSIIPMLCFKKSQAEHRFITELNADVISVLFHINSHNVKLYLIMPNNDLDTTLNALNTYRVTLIRDKLRENRKDVCFPRFKALTSTDYTPVLYKLGYDYIFSQDPIDMDVFDTPQRLQMDIRGFVGLWNDEEHEYNFEDVSNQFFVDRPFVFLITEEQTNAVLFFGKILKPEKTSKYANAFGKCKIFAETQCSN